MQLNLSLIGDLLYALSEAFSFPSLLVSALCCIVAAFFGYYIFMKVLRLLVAAEVGILTYELLVLYVPALGNLVPTLGISWYSVIALVVAILGAILAYRIYKVFVFASGAAFGAGFVPGLIEGFVPGFIENNQVLFYIVAVIGAIVFGILITKAFRPLFILSTSLGGMTSFGAIVGIMLFPGTFNYVFKEFANALLLELGATTADIAQAFELVGLDTVVAPANDIGYLAIAVLSLVGLIVGIIATVKQFKRSVE